MGAAERSLPIPLAAESEDESVEVLRVWSIKRKNHVAFNTSEVSDPAAWGIMLADIIRQVSKAFEQTGTVDRDTARRRIREAMESEIQRVSTVRQRPQ